MYFIAKLVQMWWVQALVWQTHEVEYKKKLFCSFIVYYINSLDWKLKPGNTNLLVGEVSLYRHPPAKPVYNWPLLM